jgi:hypothetical protein
MIIACNGAVVSLTDTLTTVIRGLRGYSIPIPIAYAHYPI